MNEITLTISPALARMTTTALRCSVRYLGPCPEQTECRRLADDLDAAREQVEAAEEALRLEAEKDATLVATPPVQAGATGCTGKGF